MRTLPGLPTGKSSFEKIREKNEIYVDKTRHIFRMADQGEYFFMARPRRFGKSLTVSTLKCLFQGKKELFKGLWIREHHCWDWTKKHPVVLIDFNELAHETPDNLKQSLAERILDIAARHQIPLNPTLLQGQFGALIQGLYRKTGNPVVILVDEYDKPIIDHLGKGQAAVDIAVQNREIIKSFFGVLKGGNIAPCLRFVFITGVSKFSRVSIFSELNNLTDLTMNRKYSDMMGYTQDELACNFMPHMEIFGRETGVSPETIMEKMKSLYNGYRFTESQIRVYNPFSVLRALDEQRFKPYWFETGTPGFLIDLLKEKNWEPPVIENIQATEAMFSEYDIENLQPEALLFQTGYVTIKNVRERLYTFDYPNQEVKSAFLEKLMLSYSGHHRAGSRFALLSGYLQAEDPDKFINTMNGIYASIPYTLESKRDEAYFHTIFYLMVCASGATARSEVLTASGRIDLVVEFNELVYIIEFKCNQTAGIALKQIHDKGYADAYRGSKKKIRLMGINFDTGKRQVTDWKQEAHAIK